MIFEGCETAPFSTDSIPGRDDSSARTQAIVRGREQLMEMVKDWPENFCELTLKDIVQHNQLPHEDVEELKIDSDCLHGRETTPSPGLYQNPLFLKSATPIAIPYSRANSKKTRSLISSGKVSPRPESVKGNGDRELWNKFTNSSDSDSGTMSTSTLSRLRGSAGSSSARKRKGFGCWPLFSYKR